MTRNCAVCGKRLEPFNAETMTAHEFECYKRHPDKVPAEHLDTFERTLTWEKRSGAGKRGAETRARRRLMPEHGHFFTDMLISDFGEHLYVDQRLGMRLIAEGWVFPHDEPQDPERPDSEWACFIVPHEDIPNESSRGGIEWARLRARLLEIAAGAPIACRQDVHSRTRK